MSRKACYNGLPIEKVAITAFRANHCARGIEPPELPEESMPFWYGVASWAVGTIDLHPDDNTTAMQFGVLDLAKQMHKAGCEMANFDECFDILPIEERIAWEAVARHLANVIDNDDALSDTELIQLEAHWRAWAQNKLAAA